MSRMARDEENGITIDQLKKAVEQTIDDDLKPGEDYHILYLDANNLYGLSQIQKLPRSDFR